MNKKFLSGLFLFSVIDIGYTAIGLLVVGGTELNPLYSFAERDPVLMLALMCAVKVIAIGSFILIVDHLSKLDRTDRDHAITNTVLVWGNVFYAALLAWCLYLNIPFLYSLI